MPFTPKRNNPVSRLEALSDGVFAFSATLLVVSLQVPDSFQELRRNLLEFLAFAVSFSALMLIWHMHNRFFRKYDLQDNVTVALNSAFLFVLLFYIYPLKFITRSIVNLIGQNGRNPLIRSWEELSDLFTIYSAGFAALFLFVSLMYQHASRKASELKLSDDETEEARFYFRHYLLFFVTGLFSVVLSELGIGLRVGLPGWVYMILGPLCYWHSRWSEARYQKTKNRVFSRQEPVG